MTTRDGEGFPGLHIRRESPIPAFLQLKSQFEYLIVTGKLSPGHRLPSIRRVASSLRVGPATVVRAYRELVSSGLAVSNEGVGFFVIGAESARSEPHARVRERVTGLLDDALEQGMGIDQVLQIFLAQVAEVRVARARPELIVLCKRDGRVEELAMHLRHALADLGVQVIGVTIEDLAGDLDGWLPRLHKAPCVVSFMFDVKQARSLLEPHGIEVMPLLGALRDDTKDRIIHLPAGARVGIVSGSLEFVDGMITAVTSLNASVEIVGTCDARDESGLTRLFAASDCVVHGTLARHAIQQALPRSTEAIELLYIPDDSSVQRLRRLFRDESA